MKIKAKIPALKHQLEFAHPEGKYDALVGGFGCGKSQGVVYRALELLKRRKGKGSILVITPTYGLARDVNIPDFIEQFERYKIPHILHKADFKIKLPGAISGEIWFRSGERPERIVGFENTDAIFDEFDILRPKQQDELWTKVLARIRGCNDSTIGIATTPEGFKKTYELFQVKKIGRLIKAKTTDNIFLPDDYVRSLYEQYDELLVEQYINGEFVNINGHAAYYGFSREANVIPVSEFEATEIMIGCDFNVNPMTAVCGFRQGATLIIFDEIWLKNSNTWELAEHIRQKFPGKDVVCYPDMTGIKRDTKASTVGITDLHILKKQGFRIKGSHNKFVRDSLNILNSALSHKRVLVMENCHKLINDLERVILDEHGEIDKDDPNLTHISDAFRYLVDREIPIQKPEEWGW